MDVLAWTAAAWVQGHWPAFLALGFTLLLAALFAAPALQAAGWELPARALYGAGRWVCHQRPERSLHLWGFPAAVCARDTGILLGLAGGAWLWAFGGRRRLHRTLPLWGLGLAALPAALDGGFQMLGLWESTNPLRLATGTLLGVALVWSVFPVLARGFAPAASAPRGP